MLNLSLGSSVYFDMLKTLGEEYKTAIILL